MRPRNLDEFAGQKHILAPGQLLRRAIEADRIQSLIFYGPPGTGKTSLAQIIASQTSSKFERLSGVESNVADMRRVLAAAANRLENTGQPTILFIDEIHRFNKSQQDVLLAGCRKRRGAPHRRDDAQSIFLRQLAAGFALANFRTAIADRRRTCSNCCNARLRDEERGLGYMKIKADEDALASSGESCRRRRAQSLELAGNRRAHHRARARTASIHITLTVAEQCIQKKAIVYDGDGDAHYDTISAFIKSMRGSDPDATLYWLAKMIHAGEDPRFITRRMLFCAAEDVGLADPMALVLTVAAHQAAEFVGWPEARIPIAEAAIYIATANKSNSAFVAIDAAMEDVAGRTLAVPQHLRDTHYKGAKNLGTAKATNIRTITRTFCVQDYLGAQTILRTDRAGRGKENKGTRRQMARPDRRGIKAQVEVLSLGRGQLRPRE